MKVELLHSTPLWVCAKAIRKCWASEGKSDSEGQIGVFTTNEGDEYPKSYITCGEKDKELIHRVGNKNKHKSTLEHLVYTFDIDGISRACLQELARHRIASYSVKSTRYTLKELLNIHPRDLFDLHWRPNKEVWNFCVKTGNSDIDFEIATALYKLAMELYTNKPSNDVIKYMLPEAYKTSLVMTINARSLQNFLELRTSKSALWEIRDLAKAMYEKLPEEHKYLFEEYVNESSDR